MYDLYECKYIKYNVIYIIYININILDISNMLNIM